MPRLTGKITKTFDYDDESTITIRYLKPGERDELDDMLMDIKGRQSSVGSDDILTEVNFNFGAKRVRFLTFVIESWTGFLSKSGKNLKCTPTNIVKMLKELGSEFYEKVEVEHDKLVEEVEAEEEEAGKN